MPYRRNRDRFDRRIEYLRVSVTDRCNLRCLYCMPGDGFTSMVGHTDVLSLEEIGRVVQAGSSLGIRKIRLTGGEPLIRRNLQALISYINEIPGIEDIAITTNGILFTDAADQLKQAGLRRVNISMDSLDPHKYAQITRGGEIRKVVQAIEKALEMDFRPVKINVVAIKGFNDDEIVDFAGLAWKYPLHVRFIEFMPVGDLLFWEADKFIASSDIRRMLENHYELVPDEHVVGNGPAANYKIAGGQGSIGFISPLSEHFCASCNRLRLTADGRLRACLHDRGEVHLREALRSGATDENLAELFRDCISLKPREHHMEDGWGADNNRRMYQIGG